MYFIDPRLTKVVVLNKGYGIVATEDIPKDTIIIKEQPLLIDSDKLYCYSLQSFSIAISNS